MLSEQYFIDTKFVQSKNGNNNAQPPFSSPSPGVLCDAVTTKLGHDLHGCPSLPVPSRILLLGLLYLF